MSYRIGRQVLTLWLVLAILFAQGLRLCLHAPYAADEMRTHATAIHLESNLTSSTEPGDDANDRHVTLGLALVKQLIDSLAFAILLAAVWTLFLLRPNQRFAIPRNTKPLPPVAYHLRPPLRAPPF